jgi:hypothetical protein
VADADSRVASVGRSAWAAAVARPARRADRGAEGLPVDQQFRQSRARRGLKKSQAVSRPMTTPSMAENERGAAARQPSKMSTARLRARRLRAAGRRRTREERQDLIGQLKACAPERDALRRPCRPPWGRRLRPPHDGPESCSSAPTPSDAEEKLRREEAADHGASRAKGRARPRAPHERVMTRTALACTTAASSDTAPPPPRAGGFDAPGPAQCHSSRTSVTRPPSVSSHTRPPAASPRQQRRHPTNPPSVGQHSESPSTGRRRALGAAGSAPAAGRPSAVAAARHRRHQGPAERLT